MSGFVHCNECGEQLFHEADGSPEIHGVIYHQIEMDGGVIVCDPCYKELGIAEAEALHEDEVRQVAGEMLATMNEERARQNAQYD